MAEEAVRRPKLATPRQVMASLVPRRRDSWPEVEVTAEARASAFAEDRILMGKPQHMAPAG